MPAGNAAGIFLYKGNIYWSDFIFCIYFPPEIAIETVESAVGFVAQEEE